MSSERTAERSRRELAREMVTGADAFGVVIGLILVTILVFAADGGSLGQLLSVVLSGGTLLFVLHTAGAPDRTFRATAVLVIAALIFTAAALLVGDTIGSSTARAVGLLLAFLAPIVILRRIITSPRITIRLVLGALAIYLLIGLAYSYLFPFIASVTRTPFFVQTDTPSASDYLYFSYTTLATIGFGDYTAQQSVGRMIAVSEGLVGQLYLVSAVALLVGNVGRVRAWAGEVPGTGPIAADDVAPPAEPSPGAPGSEVHVAPVMRSPEP
jgi:ion channel